MASAARADKPARGWLAVTVEVDESSAGLGNFLTHELIGVRHLLLPRGGGGLYVSSTVIGKAPSGQGSYDTAAGLNLIFLYPKAWWSTNEGKFQVST
uniref:Uncharacterized protein n=1 Tax=Oryza barthii TaxID=65489 RepID=A0A0D3F4I9_9ORYZ